MGRGYDGCAGIASGAPPKCWRRAHVILNPVLLGRNTELARIDEVLAEARLGRGQSLLVCGEPGIGKTELLTYAARHAADSQMNVLSARGVEFEADVPYAGLHQLLRPAFELIDRLPRPQALALRSSL